MKKLFSLFFAISLTLSACGTASTQPIPPVPTGTSTVTPTATQTPTATITPLPTIPTSTPTFDVSKIVTVTPAEKAECPIVEKDKPLDIIKIEKGFSLVIIEELNQGATIDKVVTALDKGISESYQTPDVKIANYQWIDLTNDKTPEIILEFNAIFIIGCQNGKYKVLLDLPDARLFLPSTSSFRDANTNGLPEITLLLGVASQGGHSYGVFEWDGEKFANRIFPNDSNYPENGAIWAEATGEINYEDLNNDSVQELILDSGIPTWETYHSGLPWRNKRTIYKWDGKYFIPSNVEFAQPEFRFQAIQDGDLAASQSEFDKAFSLYQNAILDINLKDYSPEIRTNLQTNWRSQIGEIQPTPTSYPPNPSEYPSLAAYAYYRIMLLHLVQGQEAEAASTYQTLQDTFGTDQYAAPYVEMTTAFWEAYQSMQSMYDGCAAAIQYAVEHPEILTPLGSDYHGTQSHVYTPADVCPFR